MSGRLSAPEFAAFPDIEWILKDVSFVVEPGQTVAIVGHTGAGKTTLTSLMMRFYDVAAGSIYLDGVDLRELDLGALPPPLLRRSAGSVSVYRYHRREHPLRQRKPSPKTAVRQAAPRCERAGLC